MKSPVYVPQVPKYVLWVNVSENLHRFYLHGSKFGRILTHNRSYKMRNMEEQTTAMTNRSLRTIRTVTTRTLATGLSLIGF